MTPSPNAVTSIRWSAVFPWLILVRAARVALMLRVIVLMLLGVAATHGGWLLIESSPLGSRQVEELVARSPRKLANSHHVESSEPVSKFLGHWSHGPLPSAWHWFARPLERLAQARDWQSRTALGLASLWTLSVWALFGGAIARIAGVYLTYGETVGPVAALRAAARKWPSTVGAPLLVMAAIALLALPLVLCGLLLRLDLLALLVGLAWIVVLLGGAAVAILAVGLAVGWPLMWSTVAVERTDAFDAISRGFAYLYQRPLHLLFYVVVASLLGTLSHIAINLAVNATTAAAHAAVGLGAGEGRLEDLGADGNGISRDVSDVGAVGADGIRFWNKVLQAASEYFPLAYLWPAATAIYLLLRREIDGTELTDVVFDDGDPKRGLPNLTPDAATGVPQLDPAKQEASAANSDKQA